jgi:RHS repeat-associated protein
MRWGSSRAEFKFTGKETDIEVGLTYFGARYYQANLGTWVSADPLTIHGLGGDANPYAYVGGRVMTHVDPFGLDWTCPSCGRRSPDDEVHIHGRGTNKQHMFDLAHSTEHGGWWHKNTLPNAQRSTPPQARPSPFDVQLSRIANNLISAFSNAGTDLVVDALGSGVVGQAVSGTGILDPYKTPPSERDATYYAATGALIFLGGELTGPGIPGGASRAEATATEVAAAEGGGTGTAGSGRLVMGAGRNSRFSATARPGDVTLDRNPAVDPDILADYTKPLGAVPGAPYSEVLFERVPSFSLTPQAATNAYNVLGPGGRVEVLTGTGGSAAGTTQSVVQTLQGAGFCGVTGGLCGYPGIIRIIGVK